MIKQKLGKISSFLYDKPHLYITPLASGQKGAGLTEHVRDALILSYSEV